VEKERGGREGGRERGASTTMLIFSSHSQVKLTFSLIQTGDERVMFLSSNKH